MAITPGAGFVPIWASFIIGALVSPICYFGVALIKKKLKIDDALDAFGCHGIGGIWGGIATGIFTQKSINSTAKWDGLIFGDYHLFVAPDSWYFCNSGCSSSGNFNMRSNCKIIYTASC